MRLAGARNENAVSVCRLPVLARPDGTAGSREPVPSDSQTGSSRYCWNSWGEGGTRHEHQFMFQEDQFLFGCYFHPFLLCWNSRANIILPEYFGLLLTNDQRWGKNMK